LSIPKVFCKYGAAISVHPDAEDVADIGRRGGLASRRELTRSHAKKMVAIREAKRAALKGGKPWPPRDQRLLKLS
jgi:hypothetical protein